MNHSMLRMGKEFVGKKPPAHSDSGLAELYDRHIDMVYRICYSLTGNKQDAEDTAQSVFVKLMERDRHFADAGHEKAWLIVAAQNQCRDLHRKWWRRNVVRIQSDAPLAQPAASSIFKPTDLEDNLRKLPSSYRLILYLYYYEGYKLAEIASLLKLNLNTVKTRMRNARNKLKLEMEDDTHE